MFNFQVKIAAHGDVGTLLSAAQKMAKKSNKPLAHIIKKCATDPKLSAELEKELKNIIENRKKGLGKSFSNLAHTFVVHLLF